MNKLIKSILAVVLCAVATGCYNDYEAPAPKDPMPELEYWTIKELKDKFIARTGYSSNMGGVYSWVVEEDAYICGKVISDDYAGNVYKTVYIYEEKSQTAIELRLNTGNYLFYPVGQLIYVRLKGLVIGNYRGMISIGTHSDESKYSNGNIVSEVVRAEHIYLGPKLPMTKADTLVVNASNYQQVLTDAALGRLVRFEHIKSTFGKTKWGYKNTFPNYFANSTSYDVNTTASQDWKLEADETKSLWEAPTWAYKRNEENPGMGFTSTFYYGSALFSYAGLESQTEVGNYVVRSSGYSNFRTESIPADGADVTLTAIYTLYTSSGGYNPTYQLVLNSSKDVIVHE